MRVDQGTQIPYQSILASRAAAEDAGISWSFEPFDDDDDSEQSVPAASGAAGVETNSISAGYWHLIEKSATSHEGAADGESDEPSITAVESRISDEQSVVEEFEKWAKMSPAERIRAQVLEALGLTEEQYQALPPEAQAEINKKIAEQIERQLGGQDSAAEA